LSGFVPSRRYTQRPRWDFYAPCCSTHIDHKRYSLVNCASRCAASMAFCCFHSAYSRWPKVVGIQRSSLTSRLTLSALTMCGCAHRGHSARISAFAVPMVSFPSQPLRTGTSRRILILAYLKLFVNTCILQPVHWSESVL